MVKQRSSGLLFLFLSILSTTVSSAQQMGSIRGVVYDKDFNAPLAAAQISIAETKEQAVASDEGNYVFSQVKPGKYTLVFSKEGYTREVKADVVVLPGQMTELDAWLAGEFAEMEEFIVQEALLGGGTEAALLELRMESPALLDSIGSDLISQAGAGDAANALRLVAGASVQDGKYAVIRGLPDRYVNSQMNKVRLPTADADKRAVQLDQFPSAAIESIQVSKTFTPDQQGDASGGAVNVALKGIPEDTLIKLSGQFSGNTLVTANDDFLSSKGGGVNLLGWKDRDIQYGSLGGDWDGAVGVLRGDAPIDSKWSTAAGGKYVFDNGLKLGGLASFFYERDSSFFDDGIDDKYWVATPGATMTPQYVQGTPIQGDFKTQMFDIAQGSEEVKWGGLGVVGAETENHSLTLLNMYTRVAEDVATLAEDTRGKAYYFPGYNLFDPSDPGNLERDAAPYLRTETLEYTERTTNTAQLHGHHKNLPFPELAIENVFKALRPELDWGFSRSSSDLNQPDKRQFGSIWWAESYNPGFPPFVPPSSDPAMFRPYKPAANFTLGNLQRIWKDISEESNQFFFDVKFPFEQWSGDEGYLKLGVFNDDVNREYNQDSFSNFNDNSAQYGAPWEDFWSDAFLSENHPITAADIDVDYQGEQKIFAWYHMIDLPLGSMFKLMGGARYEETEISIVNFPEKDVTWIPPGAISSVALNPGDADVAFEQMNALPAIGFEFTPFDPITLRSSFSETIARQTFKELTPIQQQEYLGAEVFIGNPFLQMSSLKNYDVRVDYTPYESGLVSLSYFFKDIEDPIEYVQRIADFPYTTAVNYPKGELSGYEIEVRQQMERFSNRLAGLSLGANATFIDSEVTLPAEESALFDQPNIQAPMSSRDMTNAPNYLYNLFLTYELDELGLAGTEIGLFYMVRGDALTAGAGQSKGKYIPNVYEKEYGTLNLSLSQKLGENWTLQFQAKNLLDPEIQTVYRSDYIDGDATKTSYRKGIEFSLTVSAKF
ncbi:MAG: TonB-dependent receptor [Candidatus Omnitrophota bacterium]